MHKRLMAMKQNLMCAIEAQLCNLQEVDTEELGAAIDMLKDLEEALYFCTITEAMNGGGKYGNVEVEYENGHKKNGHSNGSDQMYYSYPMMYSDGGRMYNDGQNNGNQSYYGGNGSSQMYAQGRDSMGRYTSNGNGSSRSDYSEPMYMRDDREGRSPMNRRMYMEAKHSKDKATQLRELEKYMQELTSDMVEMIQDSSSEEKQYLEKKISALAAKIGQMK